MNAPPAPGVPVASPPARRKRPEPAQSNVKETLEQILVAFILAFIFRCFVVEAYVIPTGSMAPTLLGAHMNFRCPDCGWHWTVNYSGDNGGETVPSNAAEVYPIRCANCGYKIPRDLPSEPENDATNTPVAYGDRILVQKYIYLLHEPKRWDVVVFKSPDKARSARGEFTGDDYVQNYIKRLIGTPGEAIMVLDGDIYAAKNKSSLADYRPEDFTIQTKPYKVQEAMWRIVFDNDYRPRGLSRSYLLAGNAYTASTGSELDDYPFAFPWKSSGEGWDASKRVFTFNSSNTGRITFDPKEVPEKHSLTDWLAYDVSHATPRNADNFLDRGYQTNHDSDLNDLAKRKYRVTRIDDPLNDVSDVKLKFNYQRKSGKGALHANLTKHRTLFTLELLPGKADLKMFAPGATEAVTIGSVALAESANSNRIEMAIADYRVSIRIDGQEVLATTPQQFAPDVAQLLADNDNKVHQPKASVAIDAYDQTCEISHISLWRDVYYLTDYSRLGPYWAMPFNFPKGNSQGRLIELGPDEFFVMGDNSMLSSDARVWRYPVRLPYENVEADGGRVPRRFMLGRAFFVYWPAGYAPVNGFLRFVPNFGEMRFIH